MTNPITELAEAMRTVGATTVGDFMELAAEYGADTPAEVVAAYQQEHQGHE